MRKQRWLSYAMGICFLSGSSTAWANEDEGKEKEETSPSYDVVVTATRIPQSIMDVSADVITVTPEQWEEKGARTVADALEGLPGVRIVRSGGSGAAAVVEISGTDRVLLLVDGKRMNLPQGASMGTAGVDLKDFVLDSSIDRIEVLRGSGSALYGSDAVGGVVQIFTKRGYGQTTGNISLELGDDNKFRTSLGISGSEKKTHWRLNADYYSTDGQRSNNYNRDGNFSLRLDQDLNSEDSLFVTYDHYKGKGGIPGTLISPTLTDYYRTQRDTVGVGYTKDQMKLHLYQTQRNYKGLSWEKDFEHKNKVQAFEYQDSHKIEKNHQLTWGMDWYYNEVESTNFADKKHTHSEALYIQDEILIGAKTRLTPGLRYENHSVFGDEWIPKIGLVYQAKNELSFYANWGRVYRTPTFDDLYWFEDWGWGMGMFGNPDLRPETGWAGELGAKYQIDKNNHIGVSFFHRELNDAIKWIGTDYVWTTENIDSYRTQGGTISWTGKLGTHFSSDANYTYQDTNSTTDYFEPRHQFNFALRYHNRRLKQSLTMTSASGFGSTNNQVGGRAIFSVTTQFDINKNHSLSFTIYNLLNKKYEDRLGYPEDSRNFMVGWKYLF